MINQGVLYKYTCIIIIILLTITACTHPPPRIDKFGKPEREYNYQAPIQIDDGWCVSSLAEEGVNEVIINDMMTAILAGKYPNLRSIVLVRNGNLIFEEYFYYTHRYMVQDFRSAGKSVTSELVGIAIDKGFIKGVDEKLLTYFPAYDKGDNWDHRKDNVSLHHVLSMKWGFDESGPANKTRWYTENWIDKTLNLPLIRDPGRQFEYHSAAPALCGAIIEQAAKMPVDEFAKKYLFEPLQVSDYYLYVLPDGSAFTAGSMFMRPRDMAKFGYLILNKGIWHGRQILSKDWIAMSTKAYGHDDQLGYGYYWWIGNYPNGDELFETIIAAGFGGQRVDVIPELNLISVFTSKPDDNPKGHTRISQIMKKYILPSILDSGP